MDGRLDGFFSVDIFIPCIHLSCFLSSSFFPFVSFPFCLFSFSPSLSFFTFHLLSLHPLSYFPSFSPPTLLFPSTLPCCNPLITLMGCFSSMVYSFQLCSHFLLSSLRISSPRASVCVRVYRCVLKCLNVLCICVHAWFLCTCVFEQCFFAAETFFWTCLCMICVCIQQSSVCVCVCTLRWLKALHLRLYSYLYNE